MNRRKQKKRIRRSRIIIAYIARAIAILILIAMLSLMVCGCLYLRNLFRKNGDGGEYDQTDDLAAGLHIVIDAGHGGTDSGSIVEGVEEKEINLRLL
jgi:N-acetylmuramoyl-L-alanine amidase